MRENEKRDPHLIFVKISQLALNGVFAVLVTYQYVAKTWLMKIKSKFLFDSVLDLKHGRCEIMF